MDRVPPCWLLISRELGRRKVVETDALCAVCPSPQGPRVMTIAYAIQTAVSGSAHIWLDQDERDKTSKGAHLPLLLLLPAALALLLSAERLLLCVVSVHREHESDTSVSSFCVPVLCLRPYAKISTGMEDGVINSRFFVLYLTECVFSRYFCQLEIKTARASQQHNRVRGCLRDADTFLFLPGCALVSPCLLRRI